MLLKRCIVVFMILSVFELVVWRHSDSAYLEGLRNQSNKWLLGLIHQQRHLNQVNELAMNFLSD